MRHVRLLLDRLEDPFEILPLQSVSSQLGGLVCEAGRTQHDRNGPYGVADKFRSVEDEYDIAREQLFIVSAFVLAQAAITQAISIATKIREIAKGSATLPHKKSDIMATQAPLHESSGLSKVAIIDAVANYCKHHYEWHDDWSGPDGAKKTIAIVLRLGLKPHSEQNLSRALCSLDIGDSDMSPMAHLIQDWREHLAAYYRKVLGEPRSS